MQELIRKLLQTAGLHPKYWAYALQHANFLYNNIQIRKNGHSAYENFTNKTSNIDAGFEPPTFGCKMIAYNHNYVQKVFKEHHAGIFMGFRQTFKNALMLLPSEKIVVTSSFRVFPDIYPMQKKDNEKLYDNIFETFRPNQSEFEDYYLSVTPPGPHNPSGGSGGVGSKNESSKGKKNREPTIENVPDESQLTTANNDVIMTDVPNSSSMIPESRRIEISHEQEFIPENRRIEAPHEKEAVPESKIISQQKTVSSKNGKRTTTKYKKSKIKKLTLKLGKKEDSNTTTEQSSKPAEITNTKPSNIEPQIESSKELVKFQPVEEESDNEEFYDAQDLDHDHQNQVVSIPEDDFLTKMAELYENYKEIKKFYKTDKAYLEATHHRHYYNPDDKPIPSTNVIDNRSKEYWEQEGKLREQLGLPTKPMKAPDLRVDKRILDPFMEVQARKMDSDLKNKFASEGEKSMEDIVIIDVHF